MMISALLLGFMGSAHCLGMCGPLIISLPGQHTASRTFLQSRLSNQAGRLLVYTLMGAVAGALGEALIPNALQRGLSIAAGSLILLIALLARFGKGLDVPVAGPWVRLVSRFRRRWSGALQQSTPSALFLWGALNGLLPCGLVYAGLAGALATGSAGAGALFMALFGLGTLPALLALSLTGRQISPTVRVRLRALAPAGAGLVGILLIFRGLALGIPYLSPATLSMEQKGSCCVAAEARAAALAHQPENISELEVLNSAQAPLKKEE